MTSTLSKQSTPTWNLPPQLREKAVKKLHHIRDEIDSMTREQVQSLMYELQVHEIELEMQNDELLQIQHELQDVKDKFQDLYDFAPVGYMTLSRDGLILDANLALASILALARDELLTAKPAFEDFVIEENMSFVNGHLQSVFDCDSIQTLEVTLRDGKIFLLRSLKVESERTEFCRTCLIDISAQKENEKILAQQAKQKDEFIAMLGHELRNPLASIGSAVMLLENQAFKDKHDWSLSIIKNQQKNLSHIIDDLLDISRITTGKFILKEDVIDLREIAARAIESTKALLRSKEHHLIVNAEEVNVSGDATRLEQIFVNLLVNAAKYTPPGGAISLCVKKIKDRAKLTVSDNGMGFSPTMNAKIFELFMQINNSDCNIHGGLGIGLTLVKTLAEMHGGVVSAESDGPGKGSTFTVSLPAVELERTTENKRHKLSTVSQAKVLLVEDSADTACAMGLLLEHTGYKVQLAHNGEEAIQKAEQFKPDRIILDIGLPGELNGYEVLKNLKEKEYLQDARFICLSGFGQESDIEHSKSAGFNSHLVKPVDYDKLIDALEKEVK